MLSNQCAIILARTYRWFNGNRLRHSLRKSWPGLGRATSSMADEHWNFRMRKHLGGHAPEHDRRNAAASVRGHDDKVTTFLLGGRNDGFVRVVFFDLHRIAVDPNRTSLFGHPVQYPLRVRFGALGVLGKRARHRINP